MRGVCAQLLKTALPQNQKKPKQTKKKELLQTLPKHKPLRTSLLRPKGYRNEGVAADNTQTKIRLSGHHCCDLKGIEVKELLHTLPQKPLRTSLLRAKGYVDSYAPKYAPPAEIECLLSCQVYRRQTKC